MNPLQVLLSPEPGEVVVEGMCEGAESGERAIVEPDRDTVEDLTAISTSPFEDGKASEKGTIPAPPDSGWDLGA